jgi:hypothetical protein
MIDLNKAQVFDPPIKMLVSDDPDFPENESFVENVYCIYPKLYYPIKTLFQEGTASYKYAKPIPTETDDFEKMFKTAFDKAWNDIIKNTCKKVVERIMNDDNNDATT